MSEAAERGVVPARAVERWDDQCGVLVVGLGAAGAAAVLEARAAGAEVLALERASAGGGTSALSGGVLYLGGGTPLQKECGFEDSPEEMFKYLMASCGPRPDEPRIRLYCEGSVDHYHWLLDQGVPFKAVFYPHYSGEPPTDDGLVYSGTENAWPYDRVARPAPRGHVPQVPGQAGPLLMQKLLAAVGGSGATVQVDTRVLALVVDDGGAVLGAIARSGGRERAIRARGGVVLATGGFINDARMLALHAPHLARCRYRVGAEGDDGGGIRLGLAAGGAPMNLGMGSVSLPVTPPKAILKGVLVNGLGQRFVNEDAYFGRLGECALVHHDGRCFWILDDATFVRPDVPRRVAAVGETIGELERELAMPEGALAGTIDLYNRHAARGEDPLFHKKAEWVVPLEQPPFGALDCTVDGSLYAAFTLGGLHVDGEGAVRTPAGRPIPGLYAAGRASACLAAPGYASGLSLGDGTFFGRRAGRAAAGTT
ncbi:MAG TPA: FAD-dependent oxidoreductase [Myxococcota bacterium]|nr:FAD-dependent oxidoreductase [Myxococcota bacterium]